MKKRENELPFIINKNFKLKSGYLDKVLFCLTSGDLTLETALENADILSLLNT